MGKKTEAFPELGEHRSTTDPEQSLGVVIWSPTPNSVSLQHLWKASLWNSPPDLSVGTGVKPDRPRMKQDCYHRLSSGKHLLSPPSLFLIFISAVTKDVLSVWSGSEPSLPSHPHPCPAHNPTPTAHSSVLFSEEGTEAQSFFLKIFLVCFHF